MGQMPAYGLVLIHLLCISVGNTELNTFCFKVYHYLNDYKQTIVLPWYDILTVTNML